MNTQSTDKHVKEWEDLRDRGYPVWPDFMTVSHHNPSPRKSPICGCPMLDEYLIEFATLIPVGKDRDRLYPYIDAYIFPYKGSSLTPELYKECFERYKHAVGIIQDQYIPEGNNSIAAKRS